MDDLTGKSIDENINGEFLNDSSEFNHDYFRQDHGGLITQDNGIADVILRNNDLYRQLKGDWSSTRYSKSGNMKTTTFKEDGKLYIQREQLNIDAVAERCRLYREAAAQGIPDPLAPPDNNGGLYWKWMDLPKVIAIKIQDDYFGGMDWEVIKRDETLKWQFYRVVETEYPQFVCYPSGKLPIPKQVLYPRKISAAEFFKGGNK